MKIGVILDILTKDRMFIIRISKLLLSLILIVPTITIGQKKLPKVQQSSIFAPKDITIDGKANEWDQVYQAYHPTNRIFYTISNDNENLYLIITATEAVAIKKMIVDGLTFTIANNSKKKAGKGQTTSITFPFMAVTYTGVERAAYDYQELKADSVANKDKLLLLVNSTNRKAHAIFQKLRVQGVEAIPDTAIFVHNSFGVSAMSQFNGKMQLTYEMVVPKKYLGENADGVISYNIRLNGVPPIEKTPPGTFAGPIVSNEAHDGRVDYDEEYLNQPTDFWGIYRFAKKI
jgi:hypothetical protein